MTWNVLLHNYQLTVWINRLQSNTPTQIPTLMRTCVCKTKQRWKPGQRDSEWFCYRNIMMEAAILTAASVSCWRSGCCRRASFRFIITLVSCLCRFLKKVLLAAEVAKLQTFFTEVEVQMPGLKKYFSKVLMQLFYLSKSENRLITQFLPNCNNMS